MSKIEDRFAYWVIAHPRSLIVATLILFSVCAYGLQFIKIDSDLRVFFSEDNPRLLELESIEKAFTKNENIIFVIIPDNGDVFSPANLRAILKMTEAAWQMPFSSRVDSLTNFQHSYAIDDDLIVEDIIYDADLLDEVALIKKKAIALHEPLLVNRIVSSAGDAAGINVNIIFDKKYPQDVAAVAEFARNFADDFEQRYPFLKIYVTGSVMFDTAFSEVGQEDMETLAPIMFVVLVIVIGLVLRSWWTTLLTSLIIILSALTAMGVAGWLGISINPASASAPTIILTLAVADSVHILVMYCRRIRAGDNNTQALVETLRVNLQAVVLTSLTTAVGFLTMNFSDAPPFHDLGNIVAIGVMAAFIYSLFLLPALLVLVPVKIEFTPMFNDEKVFGNLSSWIAIRVIPLIIVFSIVAVTLGYFATQNRLNDNWIQYFSNDIPVRVATDKLEDRLSGSDYVEYAISAREPGGISDPNYLYHLDQFVSWLREQSSVRSVIAISDTIKRLNLNMHGDDPKWYRLPDSRELAAQYLLLYEMSLPLGLDLNNQINVDKSSSRVIIAIENRGTAGLQKFDAEVQKWQRDNLPAYMFSRGSGLSIVWANISEQNIRKMLLAAFGALLTISLIFLITLRRFDMGLISVVPNLVPAICAFGIWSLTVGEIGLGLSVVVSMTLGIVVDDTVHFISKYLRARSRHQLEPAAAIKQTFQVAGSAMWVTTAALVAGFTVLTFSNYKMSADMGLLSAITIAIALFMDFILLPALLLRFDASHRPGKKKLDHD